MKRTIMMKLVKGYGRIINLIRIRITTITQV